MARADHKNGNEQNDEIASRTEKIREACNEAPQNDELEPWTEKFGEARHGAGRNDETALAAEKIRATCYEASNAVHALLLPQALRLFNLRIFFSAPKPLAIQRKPSPVLDAVRADANPPRARSRRAKGGQDQSVMFLQDRIERYVFAMVTQPAVRHVEYNSVVNPYPIGVKRQKDKLGLTIDKISDQPPTGNAIDFNFLASDPFHDLRSTFVTAWFWYAVVAAALYGAHQIFTRLASERIGDGLGGFVVEATAALSILLYLAAYSRSRRRDDGNRGDSFLS